MTQFLVTIDDDQFHLAYATDLFAMIVNDRTTAMPNRPMPTAVTVQYLTPKIVAELAPEVTDNSTLLPWRVECAGSPIAALADMPTRDQVNALADGDPLTDIVIHFENEAI